MNVWWVRTAAMALLLVCNRAAAEEPSRDPVGVSGGTVLVVGAVGTIAGAALSGEDDSTRHCGLSGCIEVEPTDGGGKGYGIPLLAGGIGMSAAGLSMVIASYMRNDVRVTPAQVRLGAGTWLIGFGVGALAFGSALAAGSPRVHGSDGKYPFLIGGGAVTAAGIGLSFSALADSVDDSDERRSPGRMYGGFALASLGVTTLAAGGFTVLAIGDQPGELSGLGAAFIGGPIMAGGMAMLGVGIPLWITGARPDDDVSVTFGLVDTGIGMRGTF